MEHQELPFDRLPAGLQAVFDLWRGLGGADLGCSWRDFELTDIPPPLLPSTMVVDVGGHMEDNRYRFWGSKMTELHGHDMTGRSPYEIDPPDMAETLREHHAEAISRGQPYARIYGFRRHGGFDHMHTSLIMPLSEDGEHVSHLVAVVELTAGGADYYQQHNKPRTGSL